MKRPLSPHRLRVLPSGTRLTLDGGKLVMVKRGSKWVFPKRKVSNEET